MDRKSQANVPVKGTSESHSTVDPMEDALDEVLEGVPEEAQNRIRTMLSITTIAQRTSPQTELMRKMTPENIHDFIQAQDASNQRSYDDRKDQRKFLLIALGIGMVGALIFTFILMPNPDLLEKILPCVLTFVAGAFGGYGLGRKNVSSDD